MEGRLRVVVLVRYDGAVGEGVEGYVGYEIGCFVKSFGLGD